MRNEKTRKSRHTMIGNSRYRFLKRIGSLAKKMRVLGCPLHLGQKKRDLVGVEFLAVTTQGLGEWLDQPVSDRPFRLRVQPDADA